MNTYLIPARVAGEYAYRKALKHPEHEQLDACGPDWVGIPDDAEEPPGELFSAPVENILAARVGERLIGDGTVLKEIPGMGKVYDWRTSPWTPANGGKIKPLIFVQHIPVVRNVTGIGDFVTLRNVLVAQGLMVQCATDAEGNVALFTPFDQLCYQARGANQVSTGCEHMHATTNEPWTRKQMRAAAWLAQLAQRKHGIPCKGGRLGEGPGVVKVLSRGHVTHEGVSKKAGFNDRSDPGPGFDWAYMWHCVAYFKEHGHFEGA
jgi:hypothetical protein